jgi:electron transport complex protein RnfB
MTSNDVYESLFDMYAQLPIGLHLAKDSLMDLMRIQFTPEEAQLAIDVGFAGGKLGELTERTGIEKGRLKEKLNTMADKGTMWIDLGVEHPIYRTIGIGGPGLIETGGWGNIRFPHSVELLKALHKFIVDFGEKCLPSLGFPTARVWATPAALPEDAKPEENVVEMIRQAKHWGVSACSCRLPHWISDPGNHCQHLLETCLFLSDMALWGAEHGMCRQITCEEAIDIIYKCNEDGLVHTYDPNHFICNCCSDCCVFHVGMRATGAKLLHPSEFIARIDADSCTACGTCADRCPVDAIEVNEHAFVYVDKCLGCGVCFPTCPTESISLVRYDRAEKPSNVLAPS